MKNLQELKEILTRFYDREPTEKEFKRISHLTSVMGIGANDEFVLLIACLEGYRSLFEKIPKITANRVQETSEAAEKQATTLLRQWMQAQRDEFNRIMEKTKEMVEAMRSASSYAEKEATATIKKIAAEQQNTLTQAVAKAAEKVAAAASARTLAKWIGSGIVICCLCLIATGITGYKIGKDSGLAQGIAQTRDEELLLKKRDAWTETESFKLAYDMYENGDLEKILACNFAPGWYVKNNFCYPAPTSEDGKKVNYGWKMPKLEE